MTSQTTKKPIHKLPLPNRRLQNVLPELSLDPKPSAQRRSTTFAASSEGVWARVNPLWTSWPLRISKEEAEDLGVDVENGGQINVEDVLRRWDPVDEVEKGDELKVMTSKHRLKVEPILLGVSPSALAASLPHLDVGDATALCSTAASPVLDHDESSARDTLIDVISGRKVLMNDSYGPWSTRYCGHQFGVWAGQLGDGRAISVLETTSSTGGRQEIQLKGAGRTPFSRSADGLAVLRSGVREYLGCEAVAALAIPTTRSLAILTTDIEELPVLRENGPEPASLVARLAPSFIRLGHFEALNPGESGRNTRQFFMGSMGGWGNQDGENEEGPLGGQGNLEGLLKLSNWVREDIMGMTGVSTADWAREVVKRNAEMVAGWQVYGFMHGVLNTDNISVLGLTIDYGPYAFMDVWDDNHICNHSDPSGLYSYRNQPSRVHFALDSFISSLSPLIGYESLNGPAQPGWSSNLTKDDIHKFEEAATKNLEGWEKTFWNIEREAEQSGWNRRFGLRTVEEDDSRLISDYLRLLHSHSIDFHTSLRKLSSFHPTTRISMDFSEFVKEFIESTITTVSDTAEELATKEIQEWLGRYSARVLKPAEEDAWKVFEVSLTPEDIHLFGVAVVGEGWINKREIMMKRVNPKFVLRQWVLEETISKLEGMDDITEDRRTIARILDMSTRPFFPWGEDSNSEMNEEEKRLCGLGSKAMLGFQCSCSS